MKSFFIAIFLGSLQGISEWLPVSSEGVIVVASMAFFGHELNDSVSYALWLHSGTSLAALFVFRKEMLHIIRECLFLSKEISSRTRFIIFATFSSGIVGISLMPYTTDIPFGFETKAMVIIGALMFVTGFVQLIKPKNGARNGRSVRKLDAFFVGIDQGFSILPGLSRSALTVSALAWRGFDPQSALRLSFMMSIPVTLGISLLQGISGDVVISQHACVAALASLLTGIGTMKILLSLADKINFGFFMIFVGAIIIAGNSL